MSTSKYELIDRLKKSRKELSEAVSELTDAEMERKEILDWSIKDVLAYVVGWDHLSIDDAKRLLKGEKPKYLGVDESRINKEFAEERKDKTPSEVLDEIEKSTQNVISFIESLDENELNKDRGISWEGDNVNIAWLLDVSDHDREIIKQIWEWRMKKSYDEGKKEKDYGKPSG